MNKKGIDISHHQGDINFEELKGNIDFAFVRTSYGDFYEDDKYEQNIEGLEKIGVPYGLYHFSYATDIQSSIQAAEKFINLIKNYKPLYPVVIDIESSDRTDGISNDVLVDITNVFCKTLKDAGYYPMIYANLDYLENKLNNQKLDQYDKWLAQWTAEPTYDGEFGIWQYTSEGKMPGIEGNVDLNISYKDYPTIIKEAGLNNWDTELEVPEEPIQTPDENKPETPIEDSTDEISYVVKKGDTLSSIAVKYNTTYQKLARDNNINDPNKIYVGQIIKIKEQDSIAPSTYIVKKGDTLSGIASKYNTTYQKLAEYNNISNPNKIYPGQIIRINESGTINPTTYIVKKGDTLSSIAKRYNTTWQVIYNKNKDVIGENPDIVRPGQVLTI